MVNTSLGTPSDTRIIIQFRSITQKIDIMLTLNDYPDALRLWELYNDSASVEQKKSVIEDNREFIFLFDRHVYVPPKGDSNLLYIQN